MADNVTLPGTGAVVGSDDVGGVQYQQVKLVDATLDSSTPIGTSSNPLKTAGPDNVSLRSATITTTGPDTSIDCTGYGAVQYQFSGTWTGFAVFETSNDNTNWFPQNCLDSETSLPLDRIGDDGMYQVTPVGRYLRVNVTQITGSMSVLALGRAQPTVFARDSLAFAMDAQNNMPLNVQVNNLKQDEQNALVLSDGAGPYIQAFNDTSKVQIIDTLGYGSAAITVFGGQTFGGQAYVTISVSNNLTNWITAFGYVPSAATTQTLSGLVVTVGSPLFVLVGLSFRYIRLQLSSITTGQVFSNVLLRRGSLAPIFNNAGFQPITGVAGDGTSVNTALANGTVQAMGFVRTAFVAGASGSAYRLVQNTNLALITENHAVPELTVATTPTGTGGILNSTAAQTLIPAVASQRGYLTGLQIMSEPLATESELVTAGLISTNQWRIKITTAGIPSGVQYTFDPPLRGSAVNTAITIAMVTASATGAVYVNAQGFYGN